jgi:phospholipase C
MRIRRLPAPAAAGAVLTAFFAVLTACSSGGPGAAGTRQPGVIDVSGSQCGGTWSVPGPGWHTIQISNQGTGGAEIDLVDPANGAVYAEIENTGPGTVNPISIDFGSGKYALVCLFSDASPVQGVTVTVPGHATGTPAVLPVTYNDLIPPAKTYQIETETALKERLTHSQALTSDQNHDYTPEQKAQNNGKMDMFVQQTEDSTPAAGCASPQYCPPGIVMDYFDGNTTTALWNYAQYYSMSDNNWDTNFGPSTPGAINVTSGNNSGAKALNPSWDPTNPGQATTSSDIVDVNPKTGLGTLYSDEDPYYDGCSDKNHTTTGALAALTGKNIGDLLNASHVTWGWFEGGFAPTSTTDGLPVCGATHENIAGSPVADYVPHHNPFEYYASTANPDHLAPSSLQKIGYTDQANHQYDMSYFADTLDGKGGARLPAVSYLKAPAYQDGHPGYSDPLDEQTWLVSTINSIEQSKYWPSTAIVVTYDDSDGWYDHQSPTTAGALVNGSNDATIDTAMCEATSIAVGSSNGRCGYSQRLPMLVISPWTRQNYVSSKLTNTASVVKFIEDNWLGSERISGSFDASSGSLDGWGSLLDFSTRPHFQPLILNPATGAVVSGA